MSNAPQGESNAALKKIVENIENVMAQKKDLQEEISQFFQSAKAQGFDNKTIRRVIKLRAMKAADRAEEAQLMETYAAVFGLNDAVVL